MRFIVQGHSMEPTFQQGQSLLISGIPYLFREPKIGDVVVVKDPRNGKPLLKRILKKEGGKYFIAGDNPKDSMDSRVFGSITREYINGKVIDKWLQFL